MNKYKTFWRRFWAGWVDGLVFIPISLLDHLLSSPERGPFLIVVWSTISYSSYWLYSVLLHAKYGQTVGKMVTKVKVLDLSEERIPNLRQSFIRDSGYILLNTVALIYLIYLVANGEYLPGAEYNDIAGDLITWASLGWFALEVLTMLTNEKRRAFHDYIAGTVVARIA